MNIFILLTILFALVAVVAILLYIRAMKKLAEALQDLKEKKANNMELISTLKELTRENTTLRALNDNKNKK